MSKATLSEEKRATATANIQKTLVKFDRVFFELCELTDRQTDRQTNKQTYSYSSRCFLLLCPGMGAKHNASHPCRGKVTKRVHSDLEDGRIAGRPLTLDRKH